MQAARELAAEVGAAPACQALGVSRATFYRQYAGPRPAVAPAAAARQSPRALASEERQAVLDVLHEERFVDRAPAAVYAQLLDENRYLCSIRTMYRLLAGAQEVRDRRDQLRHPTYRKPELLATAPNQVWSWDITKLLGPAKWTYYYLYVILDIFSRYVVGWMLAHCESADLARRLIRESCLKHDIVPEQLTLHSDRGPSMQSLTVAQMLACLGVVKSHSRPHVSNDNPFSESQFKTLDADAVEQILVNLFNNVEKYAVDGKRLDIASRQDGQRTTILVSDAGPGIPPAERDRVFQPFYRISNRLEGPAGAGIGLSIARGLARLHKGDLRIVDSATGATFEVELHTPSLESSPEGLKEGEP